MEEPIEELKFCIKLWEEKGGCNFGGKTNCENCAAPYLLLKMINGQILHDENMKRLSLEEWKEKLKQLET